MLSPFSRTELIFGKNGMEKLYRARIAVFGIGGVGGYTVEALARSGVGALDLIDGDRICLTNLNRQIFSTRKTIGRYKVDVAKERILDINPDIKVNTFNVFYLAETSGLFNLAMYDYIVDAIDTVSSKIELVIQAQKAHVPIISSMGAGNKVDPTAFEVADIFSTSVCPLARVMRKELRNHGIKSLKVVYSKEPPVITFNPDCTHAYNSGREWDMKQKYAGCKHVPGSNSFVPPVAGLIIAAEVIKDLIGFK
jgi:tRNA A37 threonylcarbamoyladenosine dehydratase